MIDSFDFVGDRYRGGYHGDDGNQSPLQFGINCVRCKDGLIAPEKSEYRHGTHIRHLWYCSNCETSFQSLESIPVEAMTMDDIFPSTVVA
jgi:hypothetical protein